MTESDVFIFCLQARIKYEEDDDDDFIDDNDDSNVCLVGVPNLPPCWPDIMGVSSSSYSWISGIHFWRFYNSTGLWSPIGAIRLMTESSHRVSFH